MPLIAHTNLPSFIRLQQEGELILSKHRANTQSIRELHIGLLNMMPDAALQATERQFFRLIGQSNHVVQFYVHLFSLPSIKRDNNTLAHIKKYYQSFDDIKQQGLDALIITGAVPDLFAQNNFLAEFKQVIDWSYKNVASTLCSCFATHIVLKIRYKKFRVALNKKCWGVFAHKVTDRSHPLVADINTKFNVPHSRFNEITKAQFNDANLKILVEADIGVHLAVSEDLLRIVFLQGHPEYDSISILKEYKRDIASFLQGLGQYPLIPDNYINEQSRAILIEFKHRIINNKAILSDFPEQLLLKSIDNTWRDSAIQIINNWLGCVYQTTNKDLNKLFMKGIDANNPLNIK